MQMIAEWCRFPIAPPKNKSAKQAFRPAGKKSRI